MVEATDAAASDWVARRLLEVLHPEELVAAARRLLEAGDGEAALALQREAEERMAVLIRPGERVRRRELLTVPRK